MVHDSVDFYGRQTKARLRELIAAHSEYRATLRIDIPTYSHFVKTLIQKTPCRSEIAHTAPVMCLWEAAYSDEHRKSFLHPSAIRNNC
jgi:hypothetical protein